MGALVQQSINDSKISGSDRPVAWDGETRSGAGLQNQLKQIQDSKVAILYLCICLFPSLSLVCDLHLSGE